MKAFTQTLNLILVSSVAAKLIAKISDRYSALDVLN